MDEFEYKHTTEDQRKDVRRQLLTQRLQQQEAEHAAAVFGLEQIEKTLRDARSELKSLDV